MRPKVARVDTHVSELEDLQAFVTTVDLGTLTAAGELLGETKGSVSRRIARLEQSLGVALFQRGGRGLSPTEGGLAYRKRVGEALELLAGAASALHEDLDDPSGRLRVTAPPDMGMALLAPMLGAFQARYPRVVVEVLLTDQPLSLSEHEADLALRAAVELPDSALVAHRLLPIDMRVVASPAYMGLRGPLGSPQELEHHPTLLLRRVVGELALKRRDGGVERVRLHPKILAGDGGFLRVAALSGAGVAVLPWALVRGDLDSGALLDLLPDHEIMGTGHLFLMHLAGPLLPPKVKVFRDFLIESVNGRCAQERARTAQDLGSSQSPPNR